MSRAPTPQTPERIELPGGCYIAPIGPDYCRSWMFFSPLVDEDALFSFGLEPEGIEKARAFAAAMRPVEASPLPGVCKCTCCKGEDVKE